MRPKEPSTVAQISHESYRSPTLQVIRRERIGQAAAAKKDYNNKDTFQKTVALYKKASCNFERMKEVAKDTIIVSYSLQFR